MGKATAAARLRAAVTEQARLRDSYEAAIGTSAEFSAFARLQAANLRVAMCEKTVRIAAAGRA